MSAGTARARSATRFLVMFGVFASMAGADEFRRAKLVHATVRESYTGRANVSGGGEIVGLRLGEARRRTEGTDVVLATPFPGLESRLCVRVASRDGLFWSDNPFDVPAVSDPRVMAGPVTQRHAKVFESYKPIDLMVRAAVPAGGDCDQTETVQIFAPAIGGSEPRLFVYLNTRGREAAVRIRSPESPADGQPSGLKSSVMCERFIRGPAIAADRHCTIELPESIPAGEYDLEVVILNLTKEMRRYRVRLPSGE